MYDGWIVFDGDPSVVTVYVVTEDIVTDGETESEGTELAVIDCVEEVDGEIMLVGEEGIVGVCKALDEPLLSSVEVGSVVLVANKEPLTEEEPLNDLTIERVAISDWDGKGDNEWLGLFDNVEIAE